MAFNNLGNYTISPGAENTLEIFTGSTVEMILLAHPEAVPGTMFVYEQGKEQSSEQFHGQLLYTYHVKVRLDGSHENIFSLQGGGLM
ncbi:MAG: hypothetical protein ACJ8FY_03285 [Gemmataceae bacterium]